MNIVIIGKGNVATNLDYAFRKKGVACQHLFNTYFRYMNNVL